MFLPHHTNTARHGKLFQVHLFRLHIIAITNIWYSLIYIFILECEAYYWEIEVYIILSYTINYYTGNIKASNIFSKVHARLLKDDM